MRLNQVTLLAFNGSWATKLKSLTSNRITLKKPSQNPVRNPAASRVHTAVVEPIGELDEAAACVATIEAAKTADPTNAEAVAVEVDAKVAEARAVPVVKVVQVVRAVQVVKAVQEVRAVQVVKAVQEVKAVQVVNEMVADEAIVHKAETTVHRAVVAPHNHPTVVLTTVNNAAVDNPTGAKAVDETTEIERITPVAVAQRH
jgi:hypothetical protein